MRMSNKASLLRVAMTVLLLVLVAIVPITAVFATEPDDQHPTDSRLIKVLTNNGIDHIKVKLVKDYGLKEHGKDPYARTWEDTESGYQIAEISALPRVDAEGTALDVGWFAYGGKHYNIRSDKSKNNLYWAEIANTTVTVVANNDQPDGRKAGESLVFTPQLFLDNVEVTPQPPVVLGIDPTNPNYTNNIVEWDYGIAKRWLRQIEGQLQGSWTFDSNPGSDVLIKYNQTGDFRLDLGQYAVGNDQEYVPALVFNEASYPLIVQDSASFYTSNATATTDGWVRTTASANWTTVVNAVGTDAGPDDAYSYPLEWRASGVANEFSRNRRSIYTFDTSSIDDAAHLVSASFWIYGREKLISYGASPVASLYSAAPANTDNLVGADYSTFGAVQYSNNITFAAWDVAGWNEFELNATGLTSVNVTGITVLGMREAQYDVQDVSPPWGGGSLSTFINGYFVENGAGTEPRLFVVYNVVAPTVVTNAATGTAMDRDGVTSGSFNGDLSGDLPADHWFEHGATVAYGSTTANVTGDNVTGAKTAAIPANITPGSTYNYRFSASNLAGLTNGANAEIPFTMPTVTTGTASIASTTITLNGNIPDAGVATSQYVFFEHGTTASLGSTTTLVAQSGTGAFSTTVTAPTTDTTLFYRAGATVGAVTTYGSISSIPVPAATGGRFLQTVLRVVVAAAIIVGVIIASQAGMPAMMIAGVIGLMAFIIVDYLISML